MWALFTAAAIAGAACNEPDHQLVAVTREECATCHLPEFEGATNPPHVGNFPTTCNECHSEAHWSPATSFGHQRFFPLEGRHATVECTQCHTRGYAPGDTPRECVGCHRDDYEASPFPNHDTFPTTCADCHTPTGWTPAMLPDHDQFFPIDGKHVGVACASCHTTGYTQGQTPSDCVGCHRSDYDNSPYPGHATFPTTCADCHQTSGWRPAGGGHPESRFPIASGKHRNIACGDCHNASLGANGKDNADCIGCHTGVHARSRMDAEHHEVGNYPTGSAPANFCLDCHPSGRHE